MKKQVNAAFNRTLKTTIFKIYKAVVIPNNPRILMNEVFKKLNYKGQKTVYCIDHPESFIVNLESLAGEAIVKKEIGKDSDLEYVLFFATKLKEVNDFAVSAAPRLKGDAIFYLCYPKGTSKKFKCDFNRDTCWADMAKYDLEGVRMVAIDDDWSAMRFRKKEFVKSKDKR
jgi:hypothetical protein